MAAFRAVLTAALLCGIAASQHLVSFATQDGAQVYGDVYGKGARAVVLVPGGRFNKESWEKQALELAAAGFRILAMNYRGEGPSNADVSRRSMDGPRHLDVLGAVHYLRRTGARSVSVVGASMGGDYAAEAAEAEPAAINRIVLLASGAYTPLARMKGPKLFILARDDSNGVGPRLPDIRAQYGKALEPKQLIILDGSAHAQFLFDTEQGERVMREILRFLSAP